MRRAGHKGEKFSERLIFDRFACRMAAMGAMRSYIGGALAALILAVPAGADSLRPRVSPAAASAFGDRAVEQVRLFATCAGRLSASIEHVWLIGQGDGSRDAAHRRSFDALIEAVLPDAEAAGLSGKQVWHLRIVAKAAQARLLQTAAFHTDQRRARAAGRLAIRQMSTCEALLLG